MNAKTRFRRKFPSKCNKPIVKWYKPHGAIQKSGSAILIKKIIGNNKLPLYKTSALSSWIVGGRLK